MFLALKPSFSTWWNWNRFSIVWPICTYAGIAVIPTGSKVMADCSVTHRTSPSNFWWAYMFTYYFFCLKIMFPSLTTGTACFNCGINKLSVGKLLRCIALGKAKCCCWWEPYMSLVECCNCRNWHRTNSRLVFAPWQEVAFQYIL